MADLLVAGMPPIAARQQRFQRVLASRESRWIRSLPVTRSRRGDGAAAAMTSTMRRCDDATMETLCLRR
ncbi:hypothetical protein BC831DRAFT_476318, partial [Entophlyctis helioformis]